MQQLYDLPLDQLMVYKPELTRKDDFRNFWNETLDELRKVPLEYRMEPYAYPAKGVKVYNVRYKGFNNAEIEGWLAIPAGSCPHPGLLLFHGYNWAYDGKLHETVNMALHGYACLQILVRGQQGHSVDNIVSSYGNPMGWLTKGILNPYEYYYRAVYMDAVRGTEVLASMDFIDEKHIGLMGGSQGGGLAIATAALSNIPVVAVCDFPFLAHFERAIDIAPSGPYNELNDFFRRNTDPKIEEQARRTLSYFDVMNHAPDVKSFTFMTVGLVDQTTPPSTVFAVFNHLVCEKKCSIWRYFGHENIPGAVEQKLSVLMEYLQR